MRKKHLFIGIATSTLLWTEFAYAQTTASAYTSGIRYDEAGQTVGIIRPDPDGAGSLKYQAMRTTYDALGKPTKIETGELASWQAHTVKPVNWTGFTVFKSREFTYDAAGRKLTELVRTGSSGTIFSLTQFGYDSDGRLQCSAVRMNPSIYGSLPAACTLGTQGSDGPDRITKNIYDLAGQLLQVRQAVGTGIEQAYATYSYTANGKQEYVIDAVGNRAKQEYDGFDRQVKWIFPSTTKAGAYNPSTPANALATAGSLNTGDYEQYGYDANGNRTSLRKRDGLTITWPLYDALNRPTYKVVPERSGLSSTHTRDVYYGYDAQGRVTYARFDSASGEGITNTYDGFGRLTSAIQAIDGVSRTLSYQYDADWNRKRITFPDGNYATYDYDELDRPLLIQRSGSSSLASYGYDAAGRRISFNGGITTSYGYDGIDRLSTLNNVPGNASYSNQYGFSYNPASQVASLSKTNSAFVFTGTYNVNRGYTVNGLNQYTAAGTVSFGYDANGNLTSDGSNTFIYDVENHLVSVAGSKSGTLRYDPMGRLYEIVGLSGTTRFMNDGDALVAEYDASGNLLRRYIHGADMAADDPIAWYEGSAFGSSNERKLRPDWQSSIVLVTDGAGSSVIGVNTYDEYGIPSIGNQGRFQYTGQAWFPDLGMSYYKARMYSPTLGRFMQIDPIGYKDQINLYAYVANDPINKLDYDGKSWAAVGGFVAGASMDVVLQMAVEGKDFDEVDWGDALVSGFFGIATTPGPRLAYRFWKLQRAAARAENMANRADRINSRVNRTTGAYRGQASRTSAANRRAQSDRQSARSDFVRTIPRAAAAGAVNHITEKVTQEFVPPKEAGQAGGTDSRRPDLSLDRFNSRLAPGVIPDGPIGLR